MRTSRDRRRNIDRQATRASRSHRVESETATGDTSRKTTAHTRQCHRLSRTSRQRRGNSDSTRNTLLNSHRTTIRQRIVKRDWSSVEPACLRDDNIKPTSIKDMVDRGSARRRLWEGDTATASSHHLVGNSEEQKRTNRKATRRKSVMGNTWTIITTTNIERPRGYTVDTLGISTPRHKVATSRSIRIGHVTSARVAESNRLRRENGIGRGNCDIPTRKVGRHVLDSHVKRESRTNSQRTLARGLNGQGGRGLSLSPRHGWCDHHRR